MTNDQEVERVLIAAGERQRAAAPEAAAARQALQQLGSPRTVELAEEGRGHRKWSFALVMAAAAAVAVAVTVAGNSEVDTIRDVPATQTEVTTPRSDPIAAPGTSEAPNPVERDVLAPATDFVLGPPIVREFEGLPLTDAAVSPEADRIAVNRTDGVCVLSTMPPSPAGEDRCYPMPTGIGAGSITWSLDGTSLVFNNDLFRSAQESDILELDLASGELTVLTDDGVPIDGDGGDDDLAPVFTANGMLYFFRLDVSDSGVGIEADVPFVVRSVLYRYGDDGAVEATGLALDGIPAGGGRSEGGSTIVAMLSTTDGDSELVSVDVVDATSRSIPIDGIGLVVADVARDRVLLVSPRGTSSARGFEMSIADFATGDITSVPQLAEPSMWLVGGGFSPDGERVALIVADQNDPNGHLLLVADIAADGSVGPPALVATGAEFAPNDGDRTIKPAGVGRFGEVVWTDEALIYTLGPDKLITLPLR